MRGLSEWLENNEDTQGETLDSILEESGYHGADVLEDGGCVAKVRGENASESEDGSDEEQWLHVFLVFHLILSALFEVFNETGGRINAIL